MRSTTSSKITKKCPSFFQKRGRFLEKRGRFFEKAPTFFLFCRSSFEKVQKHRNIDTRNLLNQLNIFRKSAQTTTTIATRINPLHTIANKRCTKNHAYPLSKGKEKAKKNTLLNKENQSKTTDYSLKPYTDDQTSQKVGAKTYISHLHTIHYTDFCEGCESKKSEIAVWARTRAREMQPKRKQKSGTIMGPD